ncbi:hypothetical protein MKW98_004637, partial [Papaver atlanticum]
STSYFVQCFVECYVVISKSGAGRLDLLILDTNWIYLFLTLCTGYEEYMLRQD